MVRPPKEETRGGPRSGNEREFEQTARRRSRQQDLDMGPTDPLAIGSMNAVPVLRARSATSKGADSSISPIVTRLSAPASPEDWQWQKAAGKVGSQTCDSFDVSQGERGLRTIVKRSQELRHPRSNRLEPWIIVRAHQFACGTINHAQDITHLCSVSRF